jgi:hypothetical protein
MTITLTYRPAAAQAPLSSTQYDCWRTLDGEIAAEFYRSGQGFLVRFPDHADFLIDPGAGSAACTAVPDVDPDYIGDLYFNQIVPLMLSHSGTLVIHASGVAIDGRGIGFIGSTGQGKSTLAAAFAQAGHPFLTDDGLILEQQANGWLVHPRRPVLRLRADSKAMLEGAPCQALGDADWSKEHVAAGVAVPFGAEPVPLDSLFVLGSQRDCAGPSIRRITPANALSALIAHSFILDVEDRPRVGDHFLRLAELAVQVECFALDYPRRYECLPQAIAAIKAHLP